VVPTFNERENVPILIKHLAAALNGVQWEAIFVDDDSPDGTSALIKEIATTNPRVRCIRRLGRRGLAGACIEGMLASHATYVAVMDGDLQHDETVLLKMLRELRTCRADIVVGSRHLQRASALGLSPGRFAGSRLATALASRLLRIDITDPLSGFFMLRREVIEEIAPRLSTQGFKILLDILATARGRLRLRELSSVLRPRREGTSKLDSRVVLDFAGLLLAKLTRDTIPIRFVSFLLVGLSGVVVHLLALKSALVLLALSFPAAQTFATLVAMTTNFFLNNSLTYSDQRLSGWSAVKSLLAFYVICAAGAISNIGVAVWFYSNRPVWWLAGLLGVVIGAVWNFALSNVFVWGKRR
jgi:dolichol-phosphate mannosyltransferase